MMGTCAFLVGAVCLLQGLASEHWKDTSGVIIYSNYKFEPPDLRSNDGIARIQLRLMPNITYQYWVNGKTYTSSALGAGSTDRIFPWIGSAEILPLGKQVSVYYDPEMPSSACLHLGLNICLILVPIIGIAFLSLGVMAMGHVGFERQKTLGRIASAHRYGIYRAQRASPLPVPRPYTTFFLFLLPKILSKKMATGS